MFRHPILATIVVTTSLLLYHVFSILGFAVIFTTIIFFLSPLLMIWMVLNVLKEKNTNVRELKEDEEWGYCDRDKDSLGMF